MSNIIMRIQLNKINDFSNLHTFSDSQYKVFGQFDSMSIERINATQLIDIIEDYSKNVVNQFNSHTQVFYGYSEDNMDLQSFDSEFSYQFVSFIDIQNNHPLSYYQEKIAQNDKVRSILLETFDKHSFILITRSLCLHDSIQFINSLVDDEIWNLCYSILSMKENQNINLLEDIKINATLNFKIKSYENFKKFKNLLKKKIENIYSRY